MLTALFITTTILFAGLFGYSLWVLKTLRGQIKAQHQTINILKAYIKPD